jgi:CRP-like cAMP-binding protein
VREKRSQQSKAQIQPEKTQHSQAFHTLFQLSAEEFHVLADHITTNTYLPGRILYRPGDLSTTLFLLQKGRVELYNLSTDGRKLVTTTLEDGTCFGEMVLTTQQHYNSFAEISIEAIIASISKDDLAYLLQNHPTISYRLLQIIAQRCVRLETQLIDTTFKTTTARLAVLLLQLAHHRDRQFPVVSGFSHEELADHLGVYRETVSTALRDLKDAGAIELGRKYITICNPEILGNLASCDGKNGLQHNKEN